MADSLGRAVLTLAVDDTQLRSGLEKAKREIDANARGVSPFSASLPPGFFDRLKGDAGKARKDLDSTFKGFTPLAGLTLPELPDLVPPSFLAGLGAATKGIGGLGAAAVPATGAVAGLGSAMAVLGPIGVGLATAVGAAVAAITALGAVTVPAADRAQKLTAAFKGLTGSAQAADQLKQTLFTLGEATPFRNDEIQETAQRFLAVGISVEQVGGAIKRVGTLAAQSGQPLSRLALIYSQVFAKGRLQGEELLQFSEAGVAINKQLEQVTGLTGVALSDAISRGKIGINELNAAILLATGDMTALKEAGLAVGTQFSNIGDKIGKLFEGFSLAVAPAFTGLFQAVNDALATAFPSLESIGTIFQPLTDASKEFAASLQANPEVIKQIGLAIRAVTEGAVKALTIGFKAFTDLFNQLDAKGFAEAFVGAEFVVRSVLVTLTSVGAQIADNIVLANKFANALGQVKGKTASDVRDRLQTNEGILGVSLESLGFAADPAGGLVKFARELGNNIQQTDLAKEVEKSGGLEAWAERQKDKILERIKTIQELSPIDLNQIIASLEDNTGEGLPTGRTGPDVAGAKLREAQALAAIQAASIQERIRGVQELLAAEKGVTRETLARIQQVRESIGQAQANEATIGAKIDTSRLLGEDGAKTGELVRQQQEAAQQTKLQLIEGAKALRDAGEELADRVKGLRRELTGAVQSLADVRSSPTGLNQFLSPQDASRRDLQSLDLLRPQFEQASREFQRLTGANAPTFSGNTGDVVRAVSDFISKVNAESDAGRNLVQTQKDLADATKAQTLNQQELIATIAQLAAKDWTVQVGISADGTSQVYGDAVNAAL